MGCKQQTCLVNSCKQNHGEHFCRVCSNSNSDHFARNCSQSMLAYHGTTKDASSDILANGFKPSLNGGRGAGVYFADRRDMAAQIAKYRGQCRNSQPCVIQCRIPLDLRDGIDKGDYGIWHGVTTQQFTEYVVRDPKRIKILKEINA